MTSIFAFFGYVKVPKEAIEICMLIQDDFKSVIQLMTLIKPEMAEHLAERVKAMQTLTKFLRAGRLLGT